MVGLGSDAILEDPLKSYLIETARMHIANNSCHHPDLLRLIQILYQNGFPANLFSSTLNERFDEQLNKWLTQNLSSQNAQSSLQIFRSMQAESSLQNFNNLSPNMQFEVFQNIVRAMEDGALINRRFIDLIRNLRGHFPGAIREVVTGLANNSSLRDFKNASEDPFIWLDRFESAFLQRTFDYLKSMPIDVEIDNQFFDDIKFLIRFDLSSRKTHKEVLLYLYDVLPKYKNVHDENTLNIRWLRIMDALGMTISLVRTVYVDNLIKSNRYRLRRMLARPKNFDLRQLELLFNELLLLNKLGFKGDSQLHDSIDICEDIVDAIGAYKLQKVDDKKLLPMLYETAARCALAGHVHLHELSEDAKKLYIEMIMSQNPAQTSSELIYLYIGTAVAMRIVFPADSKAIFFNYVVDFLILQTAILQQNDSKQSKIATANGNDADSCPVFLMGIAELYILNTSGGHEMTALQSMTNDVGNPSYNGDALTAGFDEKALHSAIEDYVKSYFQVYRRG